MHILKVEGIKAIFSPFSTCIENWWQNQDGSSVGNLLAFGLQRGQWRRKELPNLGFASSMSTKER